MVMLALPLLSLSAAPKSKRGGNLIANGDFSQDFVQMNDRNARGRCAKGWQHRAAKNDRLGRRAGAKSVYARIANGGRAQQRVVVATAGDGMIQNVRLQSPNSYVLTARVFVEKGQVALKMGRQSNPDEVRTLSDPKDLNRVQTLQLAYPAEETDNAVWLCGFTPDTVFRVENVSLSPVQ